MAFQLLRGGWGACYPNHNLPYMNSDMQENGEMLMYRARPAPRSRAPLSAVDAAMRQVVTAGRIATMLARRNDSDGCVASRRSINYIVACWLIA